MILEFRASARRIAPLCQATVNICTSSWTVARTRSHDKFLPFQTIKRMRGHDSFTSFQTTRGCALHIVLRHFRLSRCCAVMIVSRQLGQSHECEACNYGFWHFESYTSFAWRRHKTRYYCVQFNVITDHTRWVRDVIDSLMSSGTVNRVVKR